MEKVTERFIRYAKINTQSDDSSHSSPTTQGQHKLGVLLMDEMRQIGLHDIEMDQNGYIMATLPANISNQVPVIGFIAHLDTSPDLTGLGVKPQIRKFEGFDLVLDPEENIILSPVQFPVLRNYLGQDIITTDGSTLLGADDKAGLAEIMTAMEYFQSHPDVKHGKIRVAFTPDEELGRGADHFDVPEFGANFAYTVDGSGAGEIEYENFNAAKANVLVQGLNVHPGYAKNKMKNAMLIAMELNDLLPSFDVPAHTDHYEGFFHLTEIRGNVEETMLHYIIRDHDRVKFESRKKILQHAADFLNLRHGNNTVKVEITDQYYNMKEKIEPVFEIVELAKLAIETAGLKPVTIPIRGGTDGSRLSYMGLPCPNLFAGGHNFHSRYEFVPIQSMIKAVEVIVNIVEINAQGISGS